MEIKTGKSVVSLEIKSLLLLNDLISSSFKKAVDLLFKVKGKIIISGIGKSGHIASKISSTLSSIGSPSFFIHPSEANHGDLGMITKNDCAILISNSGETSELFNLILHCNKLDVPIICITSEKESTLAKKSNVILQIPKNIEACPLELAPTSSTTCTLVLGDALAVTLLKKRDFTYEDFLKLHPGGKLGQMLLKVSDVMKKKKMIPLIKSDEKVSKAILEMTSKGQGCVGIISEKNGNLIGIITDGDLRRHMSPALLSMTVSSIMTKNPISIDKNALAAKALSLMNSKKITSLCVYSGKNKLKTIGVLHIHNILKSNIS